MTFFCDKCGICCKILQHIPELREYDRGDGTCKYLEDNLCTIYEKRPDICNVEKTYRRFADQLTKEEYYQLVATYCKKLRQEVVAEA